MDEKFTPQLSGTGNQLITIDFTLLAEHPRLLPEASLQEGPSSAVVHGGRDVPVSLTDRMMAMTCMKAPLLAIKQWLDAGDDRSEELRDIILGVYDQFYSGPITSEVTYLRVFYLFQLLLRLQEIKATGTTHALHGALQKLLKEMNLNTDVYYQYCIHDYSRILSAIPNGPAKLAELKVMRKCLLSLKLVEGAAYHLPLPDIRERLLDWVRSEIALLSDQAARKVSRKEQIDADFKIPVLVSMEVLMGFVRNMEEVGMIGDMNKEAFFRLVEEFFTTANRETHKASSIHTRYYDKTHKTEREVRGYLHKMLDNIKKKLNKPERK
jgi:hypothetical protein